VRIRIEILKTTKMVVVWRRGYVERWKCWLNRIWRFGVWTRNLQWLAVRCCRKPRISG